MAGRPGRGPIYQTNLERIGLAIGAGGAMGGAITALLMAFVGGYSVGALAVALLTGALLTALAITALATAPWALLHASGRRGPVAAALLGAAIGFVVFLAGQTYAFGFARPAGVDAGAWFYRWSSGLATSVIMAAMAAGIAVVMWRVAYRREG